MAELGDFLAFGSYLDQATPSNAPPPQVPVEHLDYDYASKCESIAELRSMLQVLKSGKEGSYPALERHIENRLMELLPEKIRKTVEHLRREPSPIEVSEAELELRRWQDTIANDDSKLKMTRVTVNKDLAAGQKRPVPPVRGTGQRTPVSRSNGPSKADAAGAGQGKQRIGGYDWDAWEKFDVEKECTELDEKEEHAWQEGERAKRERMEKEVQRRRAYLKELGELAEKLGVNQVDPTERKVYATRAKQKGNECFRAGENGEAYNHYSRSLAWDPSNAVVYGNRAMACVKMDRLEQAEADCSMSLEKDPKYLKVRVRRGTTRFRRGKYLEAIADFEEALRTSEDPKQKKEVSTLLAKAKAKYLEVEGERAGEGTRSDKPKQPKMLESDNGFVTVPIETKSFGPENCPTGWSRTLLAKGKLSDAKPVPQAAAPPKATQANTDLQPPAPAVPQKKPEQAAVPPAKPAGMRRVAIVEEDDDDEEEAAGQATQSPPPAPKQAEQPPQKEEETKGRSPKKVAIEEEEEEEEEEPSSAPAALSAAPVTASAAEATAEQPKEGKAAKEETFRRVPIVEDDDDEGRASPEPALTAAQEAEQLKTEGNEALQKNELQRAVDFYTASLKKHPTAAARNNRALARMKLQDWVGAEEDASLVIKEEPKNVKALYRRGKARIGKAQKMGRSISALNVLKSAVADMDAILAIEPGNKPASAEKRAAEALFPKLSPPPPPAPKQPSGEPLLDTIRRDRAAVASSHAPHIQAVSTSTKPRRVLIEEEEEEEEDESDQEAKQPPKPTEPTPKPRETASPPAKVEQTPAPAVPPLPISASKEAPSTIDSSLKPPPSANQTASSSPQGGSKASSTTPDATSPRSAISPRAVPVARPVTVPKTAPKTLYELETAWRTLRREPEKLAQYIRLFKPSTYQKVFKSSTNPEVVTDVFRCVGEHLVDQDPAMARLVMDSMSGVARFDMVCLMFSREEKARLASIFDRLGKAQGDSAALLSLRTKYGV